VIGDCFAQLSLKELRLADCDIQEIDEKFTSTLRSLKKLDLSFNRQLDGLKANSFASLANLESLILNYCNIEFVEDGAFNGLASLKELDLRNNPVSREIDKPSFKLAHSLNSLKMFRLF
jgi:Leucine-rich repeat (LRR) protein